MRFLCFHGRWTNAEVFQNQTARIREAIDQDHEFVFINAPFRVQTLPDMAPRSKATTNPLEWLTMDLGPAEVDSVLADLRAVVSTRGPFDGLVGFSQGASMVTMLLLENERKKFADFKCAILFSTIQPVIHPDRHPPWPSLTATTPAPIYILDAEVHGQGVINIPSVHLWAAVDNIAGNGPEKVAKLFSPINKQFMVHALGHDLPGSRSEESLQKVAILIERTIEYGKSFIR